jgi:hypothetical protein
MLSIKYTLCEVGVNLRGEKYKKNPLDFKYVFLLLIIDSECKGQSCFRLTLTRK